MALGRFVCPAQFVKMIVPIYEGRHFVVKDSDQTSSKRSQSLRISQGCPLSSLLFVMVTSVLLHKSPVQYGKTEDKTKDLLCRGMLLQTFVHADNTLIIDIDRDSLPELMGVIAARGQEY